MTFVIASPTAAAPYNLHPEMLKYPSKPSRPNVPSNNTLPKVLPINVPAISMGELNNITGNFGRRPWPWVEKADFTGPC
jgi:hypothetical protein